MDAPLEYSMCGIGSDAPTSLRIYPLSAAGILHCIAAQGRPHTFPNVGKRCGMLWGGPPGLRGSSRTRSSRDGTGGRGRPPQASRPASRLMQVFGCGKYAAWAQGRPHIVREVDHQSSPYKARRIRAASEASAVRSSAFCNCICRTAPASTSAWSFYFSNSGEDYSCRRAVSGSIRDARLAGT